MPPIEEADMIHKAVVWFFERMDESNEPVFAAPVERACRWVWLRRLSTNELGEPIEIAAEVAFKCSIPMRSLAWKGTLEEWIAAEEDDSLERNLLEFKSWEGADSLKGHHSRNEYELTRWRGRVPDNTPDPYD